jgi:hypothetical protein
MQEHSAFQTKVLDGIYWQGYVLVRCQVQERDPCAPSEGAGICPWVKPVLIGIQLKPA